MYGIIKVLFQGDRQVIQFPLSAQRAIVSPPLGVQAMRPNVFLIRMFRC